MPTPRDAVLSYLKKEMVTVAPDKYFHDCPSIDDDDFPEPVEYEPSRMALELSHIIINEMKQWILLDMALNEMGTSVVEFEMEIRKKIDEWDHVLGKTI